MNRALACVAGVVALAAIATAALGSAASIGVSSSDLTAFDRPGPTSGPTDTTPPAATVELLDADADGIVDRVAATFDEAIGGTCSGTTGWSVTRGGTEILTGTPTRSGQVVTLTLTETDQPVDTTTTDIAVSLATGGYCDAAGNSTVLDAVVPLDRAAPAISTILMEDERVNGTADNTRGRVDRVSITFSEDLSTYSAGATGWSLANVPSGGALASVAPDASNARIIRLTLTEGSGVLDTAVRNFTVTLAATADGVRDAAGNLASFTNRAPADGAGPVPVSLTFANGAGAGANASTAGRPDQNDLIRVRFSERLAVSSICSAWSGEDTNQPVTAWANNALTAQIANGTTSDTLTLFATPAQTVACAPRFGSVALDNRYVSGTTGFAGNGDNGKTELRWTPSSPDVAGGTNELTIELGAGAATTVSNPTAAVYTPPSTTGAQLTDLAGNVAAGSVSSTGAQF